MPVINNYLILSQQLKNNSMEEVYRLIDDAVNTGATLFLTMHMLNNSSNEYAATPSNFQLIVDYVNNYVQQGKVKVQTVSEWYNGQ